MNIIKQPQYLLVCRSAFCRKCWQKERPTKGNRFIVYGTDHQYFKERVAHHDGLKGFTPHLYTIQFPYKMSEEGRVTAARTCLMDGCGISIGKLKANGNFDIQILYAEEVSLSLVSVEALLTYWKNTGYELL